VATAEGEGEVGVGSFVWSEAPSHGPTGEVDREGLVWCGCWEGEVNCTCPVSYLGQLRRNVNRCETGNLKPYRCGEPPWFPEPDPCRAVRHRSEFSGVREVTIGKQACDRLVQGSLHAYSLGSKRLFLERRSSAS
jgi:hypothetical protein